jgi:hypothetical protein
MLATAVCQRAHYSGHRASRPPMLPIELHLRNLAGYAQDSSPQREALRKSGGRFSGFSCQL